MDNAHQVTLDPALRRRPDPPALERLGEISVPTLVVSGDQDVPDVERIAELIVSRVPGARRAVMQGADHVVNMRRPADFTARCRFPRPHLLARRGVTFRVVLA